MSFLQPTISTSDSKVTRQQLIYAKAQYENAKKALDMQLENPQPGSYDSSPEHGTLEAFYALACAKERYERELEDLRRPYSYI